MRNLLRKRDMYVKKERQVMIINAILVVVKKDFAWLKHKNELEVKADQRAD